MAGVGHDGELRDRARQAAHIMLCDVAVTAQMRERQKQYLAKCRRITCEEVNAWTWRRQLWNNALSIVGPVI